MNRKLDSTLAAVAEDVLESLAFMLPAFEERRPTPAELADRTAAAIAFGGACDGVLAVEISNVLLPAMTCNMLGLDACEPPDPAIQRDALAELLNVICGNLLPEIAGERAVFDVGTAGAVADARGAGKGRPLLASARLHLEGGWADLALFAPAGLAAAPAP